MVRALPLVRAKVPDVAVGRDRRRLAAPGARSARALLRGRRTRSASSARSPTSSATRGCAAPTCWRCPAACLPGGFAGEGFGIVYLEAGAYGKPVVAGNVGGALDAVVDGETGLLVDPLDPLAVADAITHAAARRRAGATARRGGRARAQGSPGRDRRAAALQLELARRSAGADGAGAAGTRVGEPMRVLYVNHTADVSGGERSLLEPARRAPEHGAAAAWPRRAAALQALASSSASATTPIAGTAGSLRLHPLHTPRALAEMASPPCRCAGPRARHRAELVHANSIRAGIVLGARRAPAGASDRPRARLPAAGAARRRRRMRLIAATATTVVANSRYTAARCGRRRRGRAWRSSTTPSTSSAGIRPASIAAARADLGRAARARLLLGVVAQLTPWKGQDTAIEALRLLREEGVDAHLLLIGSAKFVAAPTRFDNEAYVARLRAQVADAGLQERVSWLGEREDVPELVRALDVLLLPSEEEPFGRALIEAMALGVPVLATDVGGPRGDRRGRARGLSAAAARACSLGAGDPSHRGEPGAGRGDGSRGAPAGGGRVHDRPARGEDARRVRARAGARRHGGEGRGAPWPVTAAHRNDARRCCVSPSRSRRTPRPRGSGRASCSVS